MLPDLMVFTDSGEDRQLRKQKPFRVVSALTKRQGVIGSLDWGAQTRGRRREWHPY